MIRRGGGSIINMSSIAGHLCGIELRAAYGAAKAAVVGLTKGVAREFVRDGVRSVNAALENFLNNSTYYFLLFSSNATIYLLSYLSSFVSLLPPFPQPFNLFILFLTSLPPSY